MTVAEAATHAGSPAVGLDRLHAIAASRFDESISAVERFFEAQADSVSAAALAMARRFSAGGRLLVFGEGAAATDAQHVSVEFVHPVIVGKRALPAMALTNDVGTMTARTEGSFAPMVSTLGRSDDIALGIGATNSPAVTTALAKAAAMGMLTICIEPEDRGSAQAVPVHHHFFLPGSDPFVAQEVGETLYHVLWELVHLFLEHGMGDGERRPA